MRLPDNWGRTSPPNRRVYLAGHNVLIMFGSDQPGDLPAAVIADWLAAHDSPCVASAPQVMRISTALPLTELQFSDWSAVPANQEAAFGAMAAVMWAAYGVPED